MTAVPHSPASEEALLGAVLIDPDAYDLAAQFLVADDIYIHKNRFIWQTFNELKATSTPIDFLTVCKALDNAGQLDEVGGPSYLTGLLNAVPSSLHAEAYAREIKQAAVRREMLATANRLATAAYSTDQQPDRNLMDVRDEIDRLLSHSSGHQISRLSPVLSVVNDQIIERSKNPCDVWGIPLGLPKLDTETGGQQQGELTILSGSPGIGKTWAAIGFGLEMSNSAPGAFITLEMTKEAITRRILAAQSGVRSRTLRTGRIDDCDWSKISHAIGALETLPFYLDDRARDLGGLRASLARLKREADIKWFILDYMMLLEDTGRDEIESTANASRALKHICLDLNLAGLVIHSVNKAGMDQTGMAAASKANLRGSGQVIYYADLILFLTEFESDSRTVFYSEEDKKRMATLWCRKGRELEDPHIRVHLVRRQNSPLWGEMESK
jgi:replicative DNA helicase